MIVFGKIITTIVMATLLSSPFLETNNSSNITRSASSNQNLFLRIDDISELNAGDKVIIANQYGDILDHFGGNPTYLVSRNYGGASGLGDKYFITDSLSNYQILNVDKVGEYFTFQFTFTYSYYWDKVVCGGKYFCYRQSDGYWESDGSKVDLLGDLYFTNNKNSEYAQWKFSPNSNGDGYFNMMRSGEAYGTFITYMSGTTRDRFWYGGTGNNYGVRLYKYIDLDDYQTVFNTNDISDPNRTIYYQGEKDSVDLTGLEFNLYLLDKNYVIDGTTDLASEAIYTIHSRYENEKSYYSSVTVEGSGDTARGIFTYLGLTYRVFIQIIQESSESYQYQLMNYSLSDYRGTYYFGFITSSHPYGEDGEDESKYSVFVLKGTESDVGGLVSDLSMSISTQIMDVPASGASTNVLRSKFEVKRVVVNGVSKTYLYNPVCSLYLSYNSDNQLCYVEENALTNKEVFSVNNNKPILNGNMYIIFDGSTFNVSSDGSNAINMFKLMPKADFYTELNGFKTLFFEKIQCIASGERDFDADDWVDTKTAFDALSVDVQGYLANLTYIHNGEESGSVGYMIDRYDYILSKYPDTYEDYMNRKEAAYVNYYSNNGNNIFSSQFFQENSNLIILVITLCVVMAIPTLFIINKRKI